MLTRRACIAFSIDTALELADIAASDPVTTTARGTIGSHTPAFLMYPVTHQHSDALSAAAADDIRAGHALHAADPLASVYVPAAQGTHVLPSAPVYPASQVQPVIDPLPATAREFAGHKLQFGLPSNDHCPSGHVRHVSLPIAP
jgi:hypothetical protein